MFDSFDGGNTFIESAILIASDAAIEAYFGSSVFLGNKILIVGAPRDDAIGEASGTAVKTCENIYGLVIVIFRFIICF